MGMRIRVEENDSVLWFSVEDVSHAIRHKHGVLEISLRDGTDLTISDKDNIEQVSAILDSPINFGEDNVEACSECQRPTNKDLLLGSPLDGSLVCAQCFAEHMASET